MFLFFPHAFVLLWRSRLYMLLCKYRKKCCSDFHQQVQEPVSVMVYGCISTSGKGHLQFCHSCSNAEKCTGIYFREIYAAVKVTSFKMIHFPSRQWETTFYKYYNKCRLQVLNWPACKPELYPKCELLQQKRERERRITQHSYTL